MNILLGITGGIAAYKACEIARLLKDHEVRVMMTDSAQAFVGPASFQALTGNKVHTNLWDDEINNAMGHIELARWADKVLIAPASANFIARAAHGFADDLLTTVCLATSAPIYIAPAMNQHMWQHTLVQDNLSTLKKIGYHIIDPESGEQACGDIGPGRLACPDTIIKKLCAS